MCNECSKKIFLTTTCWSKETLSISSRNSHLASKDFPMFQKSLNIEFNAQGKFGSINPPQGHVSGTGSHQQEATAHVHFTSPTT